jgi:lysophospholipase L1-like esterase
MKFIQQKFLVLLFAICIIQSNAQPFINEINAFRKADSINTPIKKPILFIGSSSFTNWKDVSASFPKHTILNRGFGGSSLPHLITYAEDIIFKYNPKQIVIYCGENDLSGGPQITSEVVLERFTKLFKLIRSRYPKVPIAYISMKPSPSREKLLNVMQEGNEKIKKFIQVQKKSVYINVYSSMLNQDGSIMTDIFLSDKLHMNKKGYEIWQKIIEPYLVNN